MPVAVLGLFRRPRRRASCEPPCSTSSGSTTSHRARKRALERTTLVKHVVRNALIPVVTLVALQIPTIFGGAIVTEQNLRCAGIGSLLISSILATTRRWSWRSRSSTRASWWCRTRRDLLYGWLDPRSRTDDP